MVVKNSIARIKKTDVFLLKKMLKAIGFITVFLYIVSLLFVLIFFDVKAYLPKGIEISEYKKELKLFPLPYYVLHNMALSSDNEEIVKFSKVESSNLIKRLLYGVGDVIEISESKVTIFLTPFKKFISSSSASSFNVLFKNSDLNIRRNSNSFVLLKAPNLNIKFNNGITMVKGQVKALHHEYDIYSEYNDKNKKFNALLNINENNIKIDGSLNEDVGVFEGDILFKLPDDEEIFKEIFGVNIVKSSLLDEGRAKIYVNNNELEINNIIFSDEESGNDNFIRINHETFNQIQISLNIDEIETPSIENVFIGFKDTEEFSNYAFASITHYLESVDLKSLNLADIVMNLNVKKFIIGDLAIDGINFSAENMFNNIVLNNFSFNIGEKNSFKLKGLLSHNNTRSEFQGNMLLKLQSMENLKPILGDLLQQEELEKTFALIKTDMRFIPRKYKFYNSKAAFGENLVYGSLGVNQFGVDEFAYNYNVNIKNLNLDHFDFGKKVDKFIFNIFLSDFDKSGEYFYRYFNDFIWLRGLNSTINLDMAIDNIIFRGKDFNNFILDSNIKRGDVNIEKLDFNRNNSDVSISSKFSLPSINPILKLKIASNNFELEDFANLIPSHKNLIESSKVSIPKMNGDLFKDAVISSINLYGFPHLDSDVELKINKLKYNNKVVENMGAMVHSADRFIILRKLNANLEEGNLEAKGTINATLPMVNAAGLVTMQDINPNILLSSVGMPNKVNGIVNLSAKLKTSGYSFEAMMDNLKGSIGFVGAKINWDGLDIRKIITGADLKNYEKAYRMDLINYYKTNGNSIFNKLEGNFLLDNGVIQMRDVQFSNSRATGIMNLNYITQTGAITSETKIAFIPVGERRPVDFIIRSTGNIKSPSTQFDFTKLIKFIDQTSSKEDKTQYLRQQVRKKSKK